MKSESDLFRDLYTSREISQQRTGCPYQQFGCEVKLSPVDMEAHMNQCMYKRNLPDSQIMHCHFKNVGCSETFYTEENLHTHLERNINHHLTVSLLLFYIIAINYGIGNLVFVYFVDGVKGITTSIYFTK